jgi:dipeptidyl aminopeptidase/acylaminoacyl peptidase
MGDDMPYRIQHGLTRTVLAIVALMLLAPDQDSLMAQGAARVRGGDFLRQITLFNQQGIVVRTLGDVGFYEQPAFSPDGMRLAVVKRDTAAPGRRHVWIFDLTTGESRQITSNAAGESQPIWSPDGHYIAFASRRTTATGFYRRASDGSGSDEFALAESLASQK